MTHWLMLPLLGTVACVDYAADLASYREKCKSDLLGALGLMNVGADRVLGQLPPLETPPSSGVSVGWLLFLVPGVLVVAWCRSRQEPEDEAFSAYGTRRPALRKFI